MRKCSFSLRLPPVVVDPQPLYIQGELYVCPEGMQAMTDIRRSEVSAPRSPDTGAAPAGPAGDLPRWNLADLYKGPDDPAIETDLTWAQERAAAFAEAYKGRLAALSGDDLGKAVQEYEAIGERLGRIMSFAGLKFAENMEDGASARFQQ